MIIFLAMGRRGWRSLSNLASKNTIRKPIPLRAQMVLRILKDVADQRRISDYVLHVFEQKLACWIFSVTAMVLNVPGPRCSKPNSSNIDSCPLALVVLEPLPLQFPQRSKPAFVIIPNLRWRSLQGIGMGMGGGAANRPKRQTSRKTFFKNT